MRPALPKKIKIVWDPFLRGLNTAKLPFCAAKVQLFVQLCKYIAQKKYFFMQYNVIIAQKSSIRLFLIIFDEQKTGHGDGTGTYVMRTRCVPGGMEGGWAQ